MKEWVAGERERERAKESGVKAHWLVRVRQALSAGRMQIHPLVSRRGHGRTVDLPVRPSQPLGGKQNVRSFARPVPEGNGDPVPCGRVLLESVSRLSGWSLVP
jgi:hypothetical protein